MKLFRKIRGISINKGKIKKYFVYAIGEIILIIIGILIALEINNRNEDRKALITEAIYYCSIKEDLLLDKEKISRILEVLENRHEDTKSLIIDLHKKTETKFDLINRYFSVIRGEEYMSTNSTYNDITSSGKIAILKNAELKKQIIKYYTELENFTQVIDANNDVLVNKLYTYENLSAVGLHQGFYRKHFGEEVLNLLPNIAWHTDETSSIFRKFEEHLIIAIIIHSREKQILNQILDKINPLITALEKSCKTIKE